MNTTKDDLIKDISNQTKIIQNSINAISSRETNPNIKAIQGAVNNITANLFWLRPAPEGTPEDLCYLNPYHLDQLANVLYPVIDLIEKQEAIDKLIYLASYASANDLDCFHELEGIQKDFDNDFQEKIMRQGDTLATIYCLLCNSDDEAEVQSNLEALGIEY
ncbi:hypothetical protein ODY73_02910 [Aerococcus sp. JJEM-2022b]|uniref:hypothetical protein n=1 Tax=Aerococcus mictus TaxID=2976810 RepID=UPI0018A764F0|nr:hypothetical protein [Aerococcus mictus]MCY3083411.1 hypothetical protein [Aerococcus mictus]